MTTSHVHLGAGKFGLGMVVPLCEEAGFESCVLGRAGATKPYHQQLLQHQSYDLVSIENNEFKKAIKPEIKYYSAVDDPEAVGLASDPSVVLITTAVARDNLLDIAKYLSHVIVERQRKASPPLCVIACENFPRNSTWLQTQTRHFVQFNAKEYFDKNVRFCDSVVDRVCAEICVVEERVRVPIEDHATWIVQRPGPPVAAIQQLADMGIVRVALSPFEFQAYEKQKYWCLNGLHLAIASYAFNYGALTYISEALAVPSIRQKILALQKELEAAFLAFAKNSGLTHTFTQAQIVEYGQMVLERFSRNKVDTVARILKLSDTAPDVVVWGFVQDLLSTVESSERQKSRNLHSRDELQTRRRRLLLQTVGKRLPELTSILDVHEVLNRAVERFIEPQLQLVALDKGLVLPHPVTASLQPARKSIRRMELDDALQAFVLAAEKYSREQFERVRQAPSDLVM